jgi:hypothetical protein
MIRLQDIREGSVVYVRTNFGTGPAVKARVVEVCEDVKNGRPGIDYEIAGQDHGSWAYLTQVDGVITY